MKNLIIALCAAFTLTSCNDDTIEIATTTFGQLNLKLDHRWGHDHAGATPSVDFVLNKNHFITGTSDTVNFQTLKYYVSNIKLTNIGGEVFTVPNSYHLVDVSKGSLQTITIDSVPTSEYIKVAYTIGVDSLRNVSGAQTGDLAPSKEMFWNWNTGYRFIVAEGKQVKHTGDSSFVYHLGGFSGVNNALKNLDYTFGTNLTVSPQATPAAHFNINVSGFWNNTTSIQNYKMIHMPGAKAVTLATNFSSSFELNHAHQ